MPPTNPSAQNNRLLAALPQEDLHRFFSDLHPVSFPLRHALYDVGATLEHVYFIEQGLSSILMNMSNGSTIEVGMIGMEGMVGVQVLLGGLTSNHQFLVQSPITALRMDANATTKTIKARLLEQAAEHERLAGGRASTDAGHVEAV